MPSAQDRDASVSPGSAAEGVCASGAGDRTLREAVELLFFAYRDFTRDADVLLGRYGFGRAHHRVIYFVGRRPGITVGDLLSILQITKQSLARVLSQMMSGGFIVQRLDPGDRRRRRLYLTPEAQLLEQTLTERQVARIASARDCVGEGAAQGFRAMLLAMINAHDRQRFSKD
ncbi:MAG: MarR family transcriptional regulator [Rhodospirillales bacterium]|nr:MarR family transcriptional regulator [Rhodospirillales bacterium]